MKPKTHYSWIVLAFIIYTALVYGFAVKGFFYEPPEPKPPTITELQQFLGVEDDGVIGPITIKAYEQYSFNQYAAPYFTVGGGKEN